MKPQSPCYQCPKHKLGCRTDCPEWAVFEKAQAEYYAHKVAEYRKSDITATYTAKKLAQWEAKRLHKRK
jgi:hypothetical protein